MKKKVTKAIALSFIFSVAACTSPPREVTASLPLVSHSKIKPNKKIIPQKYWSALENAAQHLAEHPKYNIVLNELYISALGQQCREVSFIDKNKLSINRIACEIHFLDDNNELAQAWFLEKKIIESNPSIEL